MNLANVQIHPHGFLILDKADGPTSFDLVRDVKRLLKVKKVGHTGTLDPIATGIVPICIGSATKLASVVTSYRKTYVVDIEFGRATDTHDRTGQVVETAKTDHLSVDAIKQVMPHFVGEIQQVPPMFSAVKYKGKPLYWYARQGITIDDRKVRTCTIFRFELVECDLPRARFLIESSQGTYVRTLIHDLAHRLESCALVTALRRSAVGHFDEDRALTIEQLAAMDMDERHQQILSVDEALAGLPQFQLDQCDARHLRQGRPVAWKQAHGAAHENPSVTTWVRITDQAGDLVALAHAQQHTKDQPLVQSGDPMIRTVRLFG